MVYLPTLAQIYAKLLNVFDRYTITTWILWVPTKLVQQSLCTTGLVSHVFFAGFVWEKAKK